MKKLISLLLCLVLILTVIPAQVLAVDDDPVIRVTGSGIEGYDGEYDTFTEFFAATIQNMEDLNDIGSGYTVALLRDAEIKVTPNSPLMIYGSMNNEPVTFDFQGHTLTATGSGMVIATFGNNVIVENGTLQIFSSNLMGIVNNNGVTTVRNMIIQAGQGVSGAIGVTADIYRSTSGMIKNSSIMLGDGNQDTSSTDMEIRSGQFTSMPTPIAEGSKVLSVPGASGVVIVSPETAAVIVNQGIAYLFDSLQAAVDDAASKNDGSSPTEIFVVKTPTENKVTVPNDTEIKVTPLDDAVDLLHVAFVDAGGENMQVDEDGNVIPAPRCTVTIEYRNGDPNRVERVVTGKEYILPNAPERAGYTFLGWKSSADGKVYKAGDAVKIEKDTTFTAQWLNNWGVVGGIIGGAGEGDTFFTDVSMGAWYYDAVKFVYDYDLMDGVGNNQFNPDGTLTRAMIAQVLYNLEGASGSYPSVFTDVADSAWYADAVNWAAASGIVEGKGNNKFDPNAPVTRQEMAAILYRYAALKGYDVSKVNSLSGYTDTSKVASWAKEAMGWAVENYVINGKGASRLDPTGTATRAEIAQILMNFCNNVL